MSVERLFIVIVKVGTPIGKGAVITAEALRTIAELKSTPYLMFREQHGDLVWDGPADAYREYFMAPAALQEAKSAINRAMRRD